MLALPAAPCGQRLVATAGGSVNVVEWGEPDRPPVLLLHGGMAHARWWDAIAARLADRLHLFAVDMPGHGDSPWREPHEYGTIGEVAIVRELLERLTAGRWTLCGHSHGALIASLVAAQGREAPERLALVEMPLEPASPRLMRAGQRFRRIAQPRFVSEEDGVAAFRLFPADSDVAPEVLQHVAAHSLRPHPEGGYTTKFDWRFFSERAPEQASPFLAFPGVLERIRCPALVVRGATSTILSPTDHGEMVRRLRAGTGAVIASASHNPHLENPADTAAVLASFVVDGAGG